MGRILASRATSMSDFTILRFLQGFSFDLFRERRCGFAIDLPRYVRTGAEFRSGCGLRLWSIKNVANRQSRRCGKFSSRHFGTLGDAYALGENGAAAGRYRHAFRRDGKDLARLTGTIHFRAVED